MVMWRLFIAEVLYVQSPVVESLEAVAEKLSPALLVMVNVPAPSAVALPETVTSFAAHAGALIAAAARREVISNFDVFIV